MAKSTVEFSTFRYVATHGHEPRGEGSWAFSTDGNGHPKSADTIWVRDTYAEAKRKATYAARTRYGDDRLIVLYVLP